VHAKFSTGLLRGDRLVLVGEGSRGVDDEGVAYAERSAVRIKHQSESRAKRSALPRPSLFFGRPSHLCTLSHRRTMPVERTTQFEMQYDGRIESTQVAEAATKRAAQNATGRDAALAALGVAHARSRDWRGVSILLGVVAVSAWLYAVFPPF
jgi:hypothetical protein